MISRVILSIIVGVVTTLVLIFVGSLLATMGIAWVAAAGTFLTTYGALLGLLSALWAFFNGGVAWPNRG